VGAVLLATLAVAALVPIVLDGAESYGFRWLLVIGPALSATAHFSRFRQLNRASRQT
jgi:hypothetical protein